MRLAAVVPLLLLVALLEVSASTARATPLSAVTTIVLIRHKVSLQCHHLVAAHSPALRRDASAFAGTSRARHAQE